MGDTFPHKAPAPTASTQERGEISGLVVAPRTVESLSEIFTCHGE